MCVQELKLFNENPNSLTKRLSAEQQELVKSTTTQRSSVVRLSATRYLPSTLFKVKSEKLRTETACQTEWPVGTACERNQHSNYLVHFRALRIVIQAVVLQCVCVCVCPAYASAVPQRTVCVLANSSPPVHVKGRTPGLEMPIRSTSTIE